MRILVIGAGGIGGYYGGRLLESGSDVTFLVRPARAAKLAHTGLVIKSQFGDAQIPNPPCIQADALQTSYDLIMLSCKAYDLEDAIASFAPAVGPDTMILPLLNGIRHLEILEQKFGPRATLGGLCLISSTMDPDGRIIHLNNLHALTFGERDGTRTSRIAAIDTEFSRANFAATLSDDIMQDMWEKWVFIATGAGITCLMRAAIGDIVTAGGTTLATTLAEECATIVTTQGFAPRPAALQRSHTAFTDPASQMTASMLRDVEQNGKTEFEHILGDLLRRSTTPAPVLHTAYIHLASYEARRAREKKEAIPF